MPFSRPALLLFGFLSGFSLAMHHLQPHVPGPVGLAPNAGFAIPPVPPPIFALNKEYDAKHPLDAPSPSVAEGGHRKLLKHGEESGKKEGGGKEERKLLGTLVPDPSYLAQIVVKNECSSKIMPGVISKDARYSEMSSANVLHNLGNGQSLSFTVPYDMKFELFPRVGCRDNGQGCSSGGCRGRNGDYIHCFGEEPTIPPLTEISISLRQGGKNAIQGVDYYKIVPYSRSENMRARITPLKGRNCDIVDGQAAVHTGKCDDSGDVTQQTYTVEFCPSGPGLAEEEEEKSIDLASPLQ